jgi:hypothetical protein
MQPNAARKVPCHCMLRRSSSPQHRSAKAIGNTGRRKGTLTKCKACAKTLEHVISPRSQMRTTQRGARSRRQSHSPPLSAACCSIWARSRLNALSSAPANLGGSELYCLRWARTGARRSATRGAERARARWANIMAVAGTFRGVERGRNWRLGVGAVGSRLKLDESARVRCALGVFGPFAAVTACGVTSCAPPTRDRAWVARRALKC